MANGIYESQLTCTKQNIQYPVYIHDLFGRKEISKIKKKCIFLIAHNL